jgi:tetratricopeptide (TPR) repeat protein
MTRVQEQAIATLDQNRGPSEFYTKYKAADEAGKQELVADFVRLHMTDSKEIAAAVAELEAASPVVSVMLSLGIAQLNLAQASPDAESRKKGMEDAEASFLSVKKSASGSDEYQLFLGQVSYWLGKHEEGKKLFAQFMTAKGESAEKRCMVAAVMRQLGALDESRDLAEKAFAAAKDDQLRFRAAELRADTFIDNDDRIYWLMRAGNSKSVQISLNEVKGHKKRQEGDRAGAEELYRKALAGYDELPRSGAVLNNSANILFALHQVTRDPKFFKDAVNRHEESSRLSGQDTVLMSNLLTDWATLLAIETVESIEGVDLRVLPTGGIGVLVQMRHKSAEEEKQLIETYLKSEVFRKARATSNQLLVLAPKSPESYSWAQTLALLVEDTETLKSLRDRAAAANFEHKSGWEQAGKHWKGEKDSDYRKQGHASLKEWMDASKDLPKTAPSLSRLACRSTVYNLQVTLGRFGETVDNKALLPEATGVATEQPSYANMRMAQSACLAALLDDLAAKNSEFAKWMQPLRRILDSRDILILAMDGKLQSNDVKDHPQFKAWLEWRKKLLAAYPVKRWAGDWALLRYVDPALADEEKLAAEKATMFLLDSELDWLINPTSPTNVLAMVWQEQMLNRSDHAAAILKDAISHGMPLPSK